MKCKTIVIWWLVNGDKPKRLRDEDRKIEALMPLVETLFPGIDYYSLNGFDQVMYNCVIPALKKQFPELMIIPEKEIDLEATMEVSEVLPSDGYEWQRSQTWKSEFEKFLAGEKPTLA